MPPIPGTVWGAGDHAAVVTVCAQLGAVPQFPHHVPTIRRVAAGCSVLCSPHPHQPSPGPQGLLPWWMVPLGAARGGCCSSGVRLGEGDLTPAPNIGLGAAIHPQQTPPEPSPGLRRAKIPPAPRSGPQLGRKMLPPTPESLWFVIYTHQQPNHSQIQPGSPGRLCMCPRAQGGYKRAAPGTHHRARPCHRGKQNLPKSLGATGPQWVGSGMSPGAQGARGWGGGQLGTQHGHPAFQPPPLPRRAPTKPRCHGRVGPAAVEEGGGEPQVPAGLQAGDVLQDDTRVSGHGGE